jgi:hypothetical protein
VHTSDPEVVETTSLNVLDRPHLLGDTVAKANDPGGESGMICEVQSSANVRFVLTGAELERHQSLQLGSKVCDGDVTVHRETHWAGFVRGAVFSVVFAYQDATYVLPSVSSSEPPQFTAINDDEDPGLCPHFAGQHVSLTRETLLKATCITAPPGWVDGVPPADLSTITFVMKSIELEEVVVDWACRGPSGSDHPPAMIMPANQLEWLRLSDKGYRIGDYVKIFDVDGLGPASDDAERTARITSTVTECRVLWATSGVVEDRWIPSTELVPRPPTLTKDFGPLSFVVPTDDFITEAIDQAKQKAGGRISKAAIKKIASHWEQRVGLVHEIDEGTQQCSVHWVTEDSLNALPIDDPGQDGLYLGPGAVDSLTTEAMETYDVESFEFGFLPGDIVRKYEDGEDDEVHQCNPMARVIGGAISNAIGVATRTMAFSTSNSMPIDSDAEQISRDWIGQIVGISRTRLMRVRWHSGNLSMVCAPDVYLARLKCSYGQSCMCRRALCSPRILRSLRVRIGVSFQYRVGGRQRSRTIGRRIRRGGWVCDGRRWYPGGRSPGGWGRLSS